MNAVETIRKAADLMERRARDATQGRWEYFPSADGVSEVPYIEVNRDDTQETLTICDGWGLQDVDAEHIAGADPAVMLAVAEWLRVDAKHRLVGLPGTFAALQVAQAYLRISKDEDK